MYLSPEEKATEKLLRKYNSCMIACLDENHALHFDFVTQRESEQGEKLAFTTMMILAMQRDILLQSGMSEEQFWNYLKEGVNSFTNGKIIP